MRQKIMLTPGFDFEGYEIVEYLGYISSEVVIGTSGRDEGEASFADRWGLISNRFSKRLSQSNEIVLSGLEEQAETAGANAIIGVNVHFSVFSDDMIGAIASGVAIKIQKIINFVPENKPIFEMLCPVMNFSLSCPIRPFSLFFNTSESGQNYVRLKFTNYSNAAITNINASVFLLTLYGDKVEIGDLYFSSISPLDKAEFETEDLPVPQLDIPVAIIQSAYVDVKRWIADGQVMAADGENQLVEKTAEELLDLKGKFGNDAVTELSVSDDTWTCFCGNVNPSNVNVCPLCHRGSKDVTSTDMGQFLDLSTLLQTLYVQCEPLKSTREIYEHAKQFNDEHHGCIPQDILNSLSRKADTERMFGNSKSEAIKYLQSEIQKAKQ